MVPGDVRVWRGGSHGAGAERPISTIITSMHLEDPLVRTSEVTAETDAPSRHGQALEDGLPPGGTADSNGPGPLGLRRQGRCRGHPRGLAIWLRFATKSALWLDEALTVEHRTVAVVGDTRACCGTTVPHRCTTTCCTSGWQLFGQSNLAVRSLAGVIGVINLPLAWLTGYRLGSHWWTLESAPPEEGRAREKGAAGRQRGRSPCSWRCRRSTSITTPRRGCTRC